jgi:2-polyprenyl-3-methyl-5-hydroxy-6-metoxy-1,4-benzoquinol methylase
MGRHNWSDNRNGTRGVGESLDRKRQFAAASNSGAGIDRWNHNIHYGRQLLKLIPATAQNALDVGCGDGWLVRELRHRVPHVVGIDADDSCISAARVFGEVAGIDYLHGDFLSYAFQPESFDIVIAVASLHHFDEETALERMAELVAPGGILAVVGLARTRSLSDLAFDFAGAIATRFHKVTKRYWETSAPKVWPPPQSYGELRAFSSRLLPGRQFHRKMMWRYVLTWTKRGRLTARTLAPGERGR